MYRIAEIKSASVLAVWQLLLFTLSLSNSAFAQDYFDDFDRADSAVVGDGWIEKSPGAFSIASGMAAKNAVNTAYRDNVVYRPASEDLLNVEASVELEVLDTLVGYPQIFVRVQGDTAAAPNTLDAYILYVANDPAVAILGRQTGNQFVNELATLYLNSPLNTTDRFRMRLRAEGTSPVNVSAWIERLNGAAWEIIGEAAITDNAGTRIDSPGAVGFGGYIEPSYIYDNFNRLDLDGGTEPPNPVPATTGLAPDSVDEGSTGFSLVVNGSEFVADSVVRWDGNDRITTFVSDTELRADIAGADVATQGSATITVFNPGPGGGASNPQTFTINAIPGNPVPAVSGLQPSTATTGSSAVNLIVTGSGFVAESVVRWDGADRQTIFISDSELQAATTNGDFTTAGSFQVSVFSPGPGGGVSNSLAFTVEDPVGNPVPVISSIEPGQAVAGSGSLTLTVRGQDFVPASEVFWDGQAQTTNYVANDELAATIDASDLAIPGSIAVTVVTPAPGGGTSNAVSFDVQDGGGPPGGGDAQSLDRIAPVSVPAGSPDVQLTLYGSGFTQDSVALLSGNPLPTTYVNDSQLVADVDSGLMSGEARGAVIVQTPDASNPFSRPQTLFVLGPGEAVAFDNFNRADSGDLGNGWTEKVPSVFSLAGGEVSAPATPNQGFNHLITYRPPAEDAQNMEVGMEFTRIPGADTWYPQVHARVQRDTVSDPTSLDSYTLFYDSFFNPGQMHITPIDDFYECYIATWDIDEPFIEGDRYRLRLTVTGTNPVVLTGVMEHLNVDYWDVIASGTVLHDQNSQPVPGGFCNSGPMIAPITEAGASGFAKWRDASDQYDNFYVIRLAADDNPVPVTNQISPGSVTAGAPGFTLTVQGADFAPSSIVRWDGEDRQTTFVGPSLLQAAIGAADVDTPGAVPVTVFTPGPGGGESNAQVFDVLDISDNPSPGVSLLTPDMVIVNSAGFTLQVEGDGFVAESVVRWNGEDRATAYVSDTQLQASIDAADIDTAGTANVTVFNPAPGGGESGAATLTILDPGTDFFDDFSRPDSATVGNGWIEKQPGAFDVSAGIVQKNGVSTGYRDNIVMRPATEDLLDTEASVELTVSDNSIGYPQLWVRLQSSTAMDPNTADGYILYVDNNLSRAILGRQTGNSFVQPLATLFLDSPFNTVDRFRLRLRAVGTNPVVLDAFVERLGPSGWEIIGQAGQNDGAAGRIDTPGSVGFGGYVEDSYRYDNFTRIFLSQ